ncbi:MAG: hypothetical protein AAFZ92_03475 [Pseudomonadota bacterium]
MLTQAITLALAVAIDRLVNIAGAAVRRVNMAVKPLSAYLAGAWVLISVSGDNMI